MVPTQRTMCRALSCVCVVLLPQPYQTRHTSSTTSQGRVHARVLNSTPALTKILHAPFFFLSVLSSAHTIRLLRDVSLENLMLAEGDVVKLVDFGLALRIPQAADGSAKPLPAQGRCGKQYYMSPEVLAPNSAGFDGFAVDVWACGIVLFM